MDRVVNPDVVNTSELERLLSAQRAAIIGRPGPSASERRERLDRCIGLLVEHGNALCDAMAEDFGWRSKDASRLTDIAASIAPLKHARAHVQAWMRPDRRRVEFPLGLLGGRGEIRFEPKGVVGLISPWNFPVQLTFGPLAGILAAGNRVMIKPSEYPPATSALMQQLVGRYFAPEEMAVVTGGAEMGAGFAALPFDHLLFTGATSVARHVMRAAAESLTPLTLELGGKSPVILGRSADIPKAAARIMTGQTLNAGQICLAPDYVLCPTEALDSFVSHATQAVSRMYPSLKNNPDYTSVVNQRHYERLHALLRDAEEKGAHVIPINPTNEDFSQQEHRRMPPTLVLNVKEHMRVMQEEIFGPILPVRTYDQIEEALEFVNAQPKPLALYYFGADRLEEERVLHSTRSGGVTINDVIYHVAHEDLPFGGIGPSGMGAYHGREGFLEFSHKRSVYRQIGREFLAVARPPYGATFRKLMQSRIKR